MSTEANVNAEPVVAPAPEPAPRPTPMQLAPQVSPRPRVVIGTPKVEVPPLESDAPPTGLVDSLLRDRAAFLAKLEDPKVQAEASRTLLVAAVAGTAIFGAAVGLGRSGLQAFFAAVKLPLMVLLTTGLVLPTLLALRSVFDRVWKPSRDAALLLASVALTAIVLAACAPVVVLAVAADASYHQLVLLAVACCGVAALMGLHFFANALERTGGGSRAMLAGVLLVMMAVGSHMTWALRPFIARPQAKVTFLRGNDGGFADSVQTTFDSARGIYHRE